jgi:hypothetical protein
VLQYNATSGAFVGVFVTAGSGVLTAPGGMTFGPDGNLYVTSGPNSVLRYSGTTGAFLGVFVAAGSGGLSAPSNIAFDPSGACLYVASSGSNQVLKYNGQTGAFVGVEARGGLSSPRDVKFGPDGLLYVLSNGNNRILRYTEGGTYVDDYVPAGSGGMVNPQYMTFGPNGDLYVSSTGNDQSLQFGTENEAILTVTNTIASTLPLTVNYATADGTALAGTNYTATSGTLTFVPGWTTETIAVPLLDSGSQTTPLTLTLNLSSPVGGACRAARPRARSRRATRRPSSTWSTARALQAAAPTRPTSTSPPGRSKRPTASASPPPARTSARKASPPTQPARPNGSWTPTRTSTSTAPAARCSAPGRPPA